MTKCNVAPGGCEEVGGSSGLSDPDVGPLLRRDMSDTWWRKDKGGGKQRVV